MKPGHFPGAAIGKACPILLRPGVLGFDILAFRHPLAGLQLVKGTVEAGETVISAARRELEEEAGIVAAFENGSVWESADIAPGQVWHFVRLESRPLPDRFTHWTRDDDGHLFSFFWWALDEAPDAQWHEIFVRALDEIRRRYGRTAHRGEA